MNNLAVVGAQWGDEGKGKVVDLLAPRFSAVVRFQGGPNAGHTVVFGGRTHALHHIPSGIFHDGVRCLVGAGALVDPERLIEELDGLGEAGIDPVGRLLLSAKAHVILPLHRALDGAMEARLGTSAIGTTRRGIGPAYAAKAQRWGVRLGDLADGARVAAELDRALAAGVADWCRALGAEVPEPERVAEQVAVWWERLEPLVGNVTRELHETLEAGRPVLFEGAQGALLDVDHGTYPFVTSSSTVAGGIPASLGIAPRAVEAVLGIVKAYATRVGAGPFPTEDTGSLGDALREAGREFGTTTGRPRRCGWFDAVAARYAVRINGLDALAVTKFDVLSGIDPLRIAVGYALDGDPVGDFSDVGDAWDRLEPIWEELPGWSEPLTAVRRLEDLPAGARRYLDRVAELAGVPVALVSVGPDREQTIVDPRGLLSAWIAGR
ncbi:MAG: adenylosuccinate synthase [Acidobacteria bacterium]|nr:MAG: adenylosuccinate synthase [Acidobacteriota bacterium]